MKAFYFLRKAGIFKLFNSSSSNGILFFIFSKLCNKSLSILL